MSFYVMKTKAINLIKTELKKNSEKEMNTNVEALSLKIETEYGFGENFTLKYLEKLERIGKVEFSEDKKLVKSLV